MIYLDYNATTPVSPEILERIRHGRKPVPDLGTSVLRSVTTTPSAILSDGCDRWLEVVNLTC